MGSIGYRESELRRAISLSLDENKGSPKQTQINGRVHPMVWR